MSWIRTTRLEVIIRFKRELDSLSALIVAVLLSPNDFAVAQNGLGRGGIRWIGDYNGAGSEEVVLSPIRLDSERRCGLVNDRMVGDPIECVFDALGRIPDGLLRSVFGDSPELGQAELHDVRVCFGCFRPLGIRFIGCGIVKDGEAHVGITPLNREEPLLSVEKVLVLGLKLDLRLELPLSHDTPVCTSNVGRKFALALPALVGNVNRLKGTMCRDLASTKV
jgi:hypothetical protein